MNNPSTKMEDRPTPETDAVTTQRDISGPNASIYKWVREVPYEFACKLERERDELRRAFDAACAFIDSHVADPDITPEMQQKYAEFLKQKQIVTKQ